MSHACPLDILGIPLKLNSKKRRFPSSPNRSPSKSRVKASKTPILLAVSLPIARSQF
ncbi:hypothetical protein [Spirulina sp. 06S082]|uniref:hypothetical protein n=1 Tax=Spirulina sp. 06S082 TaxID=3110248 RepID=UPI002B2061FF|nr:hypothetical protein [Spirulina sp. 06S082]MEA5469599.1 hypothetical protein [Spirulina sp. 06S082]